MLAQFRGKPLLLDSNLLILLLLGSSDIRFIKSFKRLSDFTLEDFQTLVKLSQSFKLATTPHILTEVSNLAKDLPSHQRDAAFAYMATRIPFLLERQVAGEQAVSSSEFIHFGLTDSVLHELCDQHLIITNDRRFAAHLRRQKLAVLTMNDLRPL